MIPGPVSSLKSNIIVKLAVPGTLGRGEMSFGVGELSSSAITVGWVKGSSEDEVETVSFVRVSTEIEETLSGTGAVAAVASSVDEGPTSV